MNGGRQLMINKDIFALEGRRWPVWLIAATILLASFALYWRMFIPYELITGDEWKIFSGYASSRDLGDTVRETLTPHNNHFTPLHKLFVLAMYTIFSVENTPYNLMSILLMAIVLILFYIFVSEDMEDRESAAIATFAMGTTSVFHQIMYWPFLHGHVLSMIFLLLALIGSQRGLKHGGARYFIVASGASFVSALFFTTGFLAAPLASIYIILYALTVKPVPLKTLTLRVSITMAPLLIIVPIYMHFTSGGLADSNTILSPYMLMKIALTMIGNVALMEFIPINPNPYVAVIEFLKERFSINIIDLMSINAILTIPCLTVVLFISICIIHIYTKASAKLRPMILFGTIFIAVFAGLHAAGRGGFYEGGINQMISINRYNFFPSVGLFMIIGTGISHISRRYGKRGFYAAVVIFLSLAVFHQSVLINFSSRNMKEYTTKNPKMEQLKLIMKNPNSKAFNLKPGQLRMWKYLSIFKTRDDEVISSPEMLYVLRSHMDVKPEDIVVANGRANIEKKSVAVIEGPAEIVISSSRPNKIQHLIFKLKSLDDSDIR
jgi:hypothetical protein